MFAYKSCKDLFPMWHINLAQVLSMKYPQGFSNIVLMSRFEYSGVSEVGCSILPELLDTYSIVW